MTKTLKPQPLTRDAFASFGEVIQTNGANSFQINEGTTTRFHDLANVDTAEQNGRPIISIFRGDPRPMPFPIRIMERHPLASQAFVPLSAKPYLVVVAKPEIMDGKSITAEDLYAFTAQPGQGVNYARNVWHHPLIALDIQSDFLIVDRGGDGDNLVEAYFDEPIAVLDC
ncbi:ureidoglycolate lyase [Pelagibius sp. Alg239-R121]|uniref:ureidoglycolate lyase n=1 Tax=Pelagibius sp. Alg239-R121 TaxID=2993448 RepID=UPI0024A74DA6|nr:ureidoglycolate lyase [Pelagibius sp. Alg239-R121]